MRYNLQDKSARGWSRIRSFFWIAALGVSALLAVAQVAGNDEDGDGIGDLFERFFGLDLTADDASHDPDGDGLTNLEEFDLGTDPYNPDTDFDAWSDNEDEAPVSRAVYLWGEPRFTLGATNLYMRPVWASDGLAVGGSAFAGGDFEQGWVLGQATDRLLMGVDRAYVTNDLWLAVAADGQSALGYSVSLLDSNDVEIAQVAGLEEWVAPWMGCRLPLADWPQASVVSIQSTQGVALVVASLLYSDTNGDGLDDEQNAQLLGGVLAPASTNSPFAGSAPETGTNGVAPLCEWIGFESSEGYAPGYLDGQNGWQSSSGVYVASGDSAEGGQSLVLTRNTPAEVDSRAAAKEVVADFTNSAVWVSMRMKCVADGPRLPRSQIGAAAFILDSAGHVVAYDGTTDTWIPSSQQFPNATGLWARVDFFLDYASKTYTLCFQGVATHQNLGFADPALTRPNRLYFRNDSAFEGGDAKADAIRVSPDEPVGLDFDGDELTNAFERKLGLDVWSWDSDGDGLSDGDELEFGYDPRVNNEDYDGDSLANAEEREIGTDPSKPDSDGDGTPDLWLASSSDGVSASHLSGQWGGCGTTLVGLGHSTMRAEYALSVPEPGFYRLALELSNATNAVAAFRFQILVDGQPFKWVTTNLNAQAQSLFTDTPWLTAGTHVFRIAWLDSSYSDKLLAIHSLALFGFDAPDADGDGFQDWMLTRLLAAGSDTDADGLGDAEEAFAGFDPLNSDTDGDTLSDGEELTLFGTDPLSDDYDNDGMTDTLSVASRSGADTSYRRSFHITAAWSESDGGLISQTGNAECYYDLDVPTNGGFRFGVTLRNGPTDPPDGYMYQVAVTVDGVSAGTAVVRADCDVAGTGWVTLPWLQTGTRRFGLRWKNDSADSTRPTSIVIEGVDLRAVDAPDTDGDGVQDWIEKLLPSKGDTDGDGLSDQAEIFNLRTNPYCKDTDGDGLTDGQEVGTYKTDPLSGDTDGDGASDGEEVSALGTNPSAAEFPSAFDAVADTAPGCAALSSSGDWYASGTELRCVRRGSAEYRLTAPSAGIYAVSVQAALAWAGVVDRATSPVTTAELLFYADGLYLGRVKLRSSGQTPDTVRVFTPCLSAGPHTVRVIYNNLYSDQSLHLMRVSLMAAAGGADADGDGIADWANAIAASRSGMDAVAWSYTSPVCLEGDTDFPSLTSCSVSAQGATSAVSVRAGVAGRWYADAPLDESAASTVGVLFENGAAAVSAPVAWHALDLASPSAPASLVIRPDDALRVTCSPAGATQAAVRVSADGVGTFLTASDSAAVVRFSSPGSYRVTATYLGDPEVSGGLDVIVAGGALPDTPPACMPTVSRLWAVPDIGDGTAVESDAGLAVAAAGTNSLSLKLSEPYGSHRLVLRARPGGAILDSVAVAGFWLQDTPEAYMLVEQQCDGYGLWRADLVQWGLPQGVDIVISTIVTGVMFDDLSLSRTVTAANFDGGGQYYYRLIHPNSIASSACHNVKAYQDGVPVGDAWCAGSAIPEVLK